MLFSSQKAATNFATNLAVGVPKDPERQRARAAGKVEND
jgi:hypothetical protein